MLNIPRPALKRQEYNEEQKIVLGISIMLLLSINFMISYLNDTYFKDHLFEVISPGFWLNIFNTILLYSILYLNKDFAGWQWKDIGLGKPRTWWETLFVTGVTLGAMVLISIFVQPWAYSLSSPPDISHYAILQQNLPLLISSIVVTFITSAFLQEVIFRAFLINALDVLTGNNSHSIWFALVISSIVFGLMHAWQGFSGILLTGIVGFVFGIIYLLNGRRIWPLVIVHGILDTITLVYVYNS